MANKTIPDFLDKDTIWDDADLIPGWGTSAGLNIETTLALFRQLSIFKVPTSDSTTALSITTFGKYIFTGSANTVWTLPAGSSALDGLPFIWVNKSSNTSTVTIKNSAAATQIVLPKNVIKQGFWDNTGSRWIIY